ncbi:MULTISPECIES: hypothetical protein [Streptomyces]|uniref:hypothetical protein n=1 Tax=Streptomyces TaxID=1883 RepID=UPI00364DEDF9
MRDLHARAETLSADLASGHWRPNRFDKRALRKLSGTEDTVIDREAIVTMFNELYDERGPRQINKMMGRADGLADGHGGRAEPAVDSRAPRRPGGAARSAFSRPRYGVAV